MLVLDCVAQDLETMEADTVQWADDLRRVIPVLENIESASNDMAHDLQRVSDTVAGAYEDALLDTDVAHQLASGINKLAEALGDMYSCESAIRQSVHTALTAMVRGLTKELAALREQLAEDRVRWEQAADREAVAYENQVRADWAHDRI